LHHDSNTDTYSLFVLIDVDTAKNNTEPYNFIEMNAGIRTLLAQKNLNYHLSRKINNN
jgi:hypothetical protein